jgi:pseudoazurin
MEGLIPAGAEAWHSGMGENYQRTFTVEGIYVYKCTPHFGAGMGGVVIVGKPTNLAEVQAFKAKGATKRLVKKALAAAIKL